MHVIGSYMDLLERCELFSERCALENAVFAQYGNILDEADEASERFVPGWKCFAWVRNSVVVCPNCNTKIIPLNTNTTTWRPQAKAIPSCVTCHQPLFTCSVCSLPGGKGGGDDS